MDAENKRSVVFLGHAQSGKTSLAESLLFKCKATSRKGTVLEGNTVSDYSWDEIERKISINSSFLFCDYADTRIQIVDTPGYIDFFGETVSSVRSADNAVIVIDAVSGVGVGTQKAWALAQELNLPRIIFINKIDAENTDIDKVAGEIREALSNKAVMLGDTNQLVDLVAESDDKLLEKYLNSGSLSAEELAAGLRSAVINAKVFPIILGSGLKDQGLDELLKAMKEYLASPQERPAVELMEGKVDFSVSAPLSAFVFKNIIDPYVGQLSLVRIFSGKLHSGSTFYNASRKESERFGQLYILQGKEQRIIGEASSGDIVAIPKLKETHAGDSLAESAHPVIFPGFVFPEPMMSASIKPRSRQDEEKISQSLAKLTLEDPTLKVHRDTETKEEIVSGLGDLHLQVMTGRLKKRFNVEVDLGIPKVPYRETVTRSVRVQGKYKKQSGGRGQYGDAWIQLKPLDSGKGFEFVDKIFGGAIPRNFIPSVEKGIRNVLVEGVIAGCPIVDVQVVLDDGSYHDVDSSDMAFQIAGAMAFRKAMAEAHPVILEPIMEVEVYIPEEFVGQVSGDLNARRGRPLGMDVRARTNILKAQVPLSEMFTYATDLRSMTQGKGVFNMKFLRYEQAPLKIANTVISKYQTEHNKKEVEV